MRELACSQPSFGNLGLKTIHRMIDDYLVKAKGFGPLLSERSVGIIWKTLMLPGPTLPKLVLIPINLSLPQYCRIQ
jgi:predicted DNA repair protein MutK